MRIAESASHLVFERSMHLGVTPLSMSESVSLIITKQNVFELSNNSQIKNECEAFQSNEVVTNGLPSIPCDFIV